MGHQSDDESRLYRAFLGLGSDSRVTGSDLSDGVTVDASSVLTSCSLSDGKVSGCALTNVTAESIEAESAVLVNVTARKVKAGKGAVIYNVVDDSEVSRRGAAAATGLLACSSRWY